MKKPILLLLVVLLSNYLKAQCQMEDPTVANGNTPSTQTLPSTSPPSPCNVSDNYAPFNPDHTPIKVLKVRFHVLRDANGQGNFNDADAVQYINDLLGIANWPETNHRLSNLVQMDLPTGNSTPLITDSRIRFELSAAVNDPADTDGDGICFHNSSGNYYFAPSMTPTLDANYPSGTVIDYGPYGSPARDYRQYDVFGDQSGEVINVYLVPFHPVYNTEVAAGTIVNNKPLGIPHWGWGEWGGNNVVLIGAYERFKNLDNNPVQGPHPGTDFTGWFYGFAQNAYSGLLTHEIFHNLGLTHPSQSNDNFFTGFDCSDSPKGIPISSGNNVMDYGSDQEALTPCQLGILHYNLTHRPNLYYEKLKANFCELPTVGPFPTLTIYSGENIIWNSSKILDSDINIQSNATLTINCYVGMPKNASIIVERGGKLIVDGGIITGNCDNIWSGIQVYGSPLIQHSTSSLNNGYLEVKNGSLIENANNAIYTGQIGTNVNDGGLVYITNSTFLNNRIAVNIPDYGDPGLVIRNKSVLEGNTFDCDAAVHNGYGVNHHVAVVNSHGIRIFGNTFKNSAPIGIFVDNFRGRGINCLNSTIYLDATYDPNSIQAPCDLPDGDGNIFDGLTYGIVLNDWVPGQSVKTTKILENEFKNCRFGIYIESDGALKIYKNQFYWDIDNVDYLNPDVYGIYYYDAGAQLAVYDNQIDFNTAPHTNYKVGMLVRNSSVNLLSSHIYRNQITNTDLPQSSSPATLGMSMWFDNSLLELRCNTFNDLHYDWEVQGTLKSPQGNPSIGTNVFSNNASLNIFCVGVNLTIYPDLASVTPTVSGTVTVLAANSPDLCPNTNPCDMRSDGLNEPGSDNGGEGGGGGFGVEQVYIVPDVYENINRKDYAQAHALANNLESPRKEVHNWYISLYESNRGVSSINEEDIKFLLKYACQENATGNFANTILESFSDAPFECRNQKRDHNSQIANTGLKLKEIDMTVFPNPTAGDVTVEYDLGESEEGTIVLTDILGKTHYVKPVQGNSGQVQINLNSLVSGTYFLTLRSENGSTLVQKITVVK